LRNEVSTRILFLTHQHPKQFQNPKLGRVRGPTTPARRRVLGQSTV